MNRKKDPQEIREALEESFLQLDIFSEVEIHTSIRLTPARNGKQATGACPYDDCPGDDDGFIVFPELSARRCHYYCRTCQRKGNILTLVREIKGLTFVQACEALGIPNPYRDGPAVPARAAAAATPRRVPGPSPEDVLLLEDMKTLYPRMRANLTHERARAYLAERGIPFEIAEALGLGYIPPAKAGLEGDGQQLALQWCDRIIFPVASRQGQGFTGRALALWQPGLDEDKHKEILKERGIPRYLNTYNAGYFHTEALAGDHITIVEGPFDALALIAGGITDALATCGVSIDPDFIPVKICDATLAYDGDRSGKSAAADWGRVLRRKGILIRLCTPPDDGLGKDWSERYRLYGREGLAILLQEESQAEGDGQMDEAAGVSTGQEELTRCAECGTSIEDESREFFYWAISDLEAICYCTVCRDPDTCEPIARPQLSKEEIIRRIAAVLNATVSTTTDSPLQQQPAVLDYWTTVHAKLYAAGYRHETSVPAAPPPRVYPAPFPCYELTEAGLTIVGMWHPSEPRLLTDEELAS